MAPPRRTALLTRANRGISEAIALGLAREGLHVPVGSRDGISEGLFRDRQPISWLDGS